MYAESKNTLKSAPPSSLKTRLNFHLSHKLGDETALMEHHEQLQDVLEDQLSLAAIHYLRAHYQEAIDIYKRILLQNRQVKKLNKVDPPKMDGYYVSSTLNSFQKSSKSKEDQYDQLMFMDALLGNEGYLLKYSNPLLLFKIYHILMIIISECVFCF